MAVSKCVCTHFAASHYPISRKGPDNTSGPAILLVCSDKKSPPPGLLENIQYMKTFFLELNLRINSIHIFTPHGLKSALTVITNPELDRSKYTEAIPDGIWNARILKEDSLCFIGVIAYGNNTCTRLPRNKDYINDVNIEEFFNEDNCVLLRGKPKLFLYFKYHLDIQNVTETPLTPISPNVFSGTLSWEHNSISSTNMNFLSCYINEFGVNTLHTESRGSIVLMKLSTVYLRERCHIFSLFRTLLNEMITLIESDQRFKNEQIPCCISVARNRLRANLFLLQPLGQLASEEQDSEFELTQIQSDPSTDTATYNVPEVSSKKSYFPNLDSYKSLFSTHQTPSHTFSQTINPIKQISETNTALQPKPIPNNGELSNVAHYKVKTCDKMKQNSRNSATSGNPFRNNETESKTVGLTQISENNIAIQDVPPKKQKAKQKRHRKTCVSDAIDNSTSDQLPQKKVHVSHASQ